MEKFMYETDRERALRDVYDHLQDEESRRIYADRSLFSLSDDNTYMSEIIRNMTVAQTLREQLKIHKDKQLVLFGAGTWGKAISQFFPEISWDYIVDNNKVGQKLNDNKIVSLSEICDINNCYFVIAVLFQYRVVTEQLLTRGISEENMLVLGKIVEQRQYFDLPFLNFSKNEVFVDAGGFNGDTTIEFIKLTNSQYSKIYVFEPNRELAIECRRALSDFKNCEVIQKGVWDSEQTLEFFEAGEGSRIVECKENILSIETTTIDQVLDGRIATYIKMDVEGAEMKALKGAKETICKYKPKLAISVYHRRTDIWQIPMLLLQYNPNYKFYLRVYSFTGNDTVLYAL